MTNLIGNFFCTVTLFIPDGYTPMRCLRQAALRLRQISFHHQRYLIHREP
ncbi:hypothetical protein [Nostoc sp. FACHB-280]|nr:hypothetical protein [Nostoc sp. FACHB-280]MBD2498230.1 hypothetical protein [Nostoc sp. FACHB-280]